jgi:hypothetical protein
MRINYNGHDITISDSSTVILSHGRLEIRPINPPKSVYIPLKIGPDHRTYRPSIDEFNADVAALKRHQTINTAPLTETVRSGNGHKAAKIRSLNEEEKNHIRVWFNALNGEIRPDACVRLHTSMKTKTEISIFQITGFVTYLHSQVMSGLATVRNIDRYLAYLQSHRDMWAKYNSPKYAAMRAKNHFVAQLV